MRLAIWSRDLPGGVGVAESDGNHGVGAVAQPPPSGATALLSAGDQAARGDDQRGDVLSHLAGDLGKYRGIGVGGEHDAGVPEHVLDDFQVGSGGQGEAGGTVAEVVQADRRQAAGVVELAEVARQPVRRHGSPLGRVNT